MCRVLIVFLMLGGYLFSQSLYVAVSANVSYAISDLIKEFNKQYPNIKVIPILGSSGKLTAQITNDAPYSIFMSADMKYPTILYDKRIAITKPTVYAKGSLVLFSATKRDFSNGLKLLEDNNIKKIAVANPTTAPYGKATILALKNAKIYHKIKNKLIYAESISQAISYTINASDIGIVAKSLLFCDKMADYKKNINWVDINPTLYLPIKQGVVLIKNTKEANLFYRFILSKQAKMVFNRFGYD